MVDLNADTLSAAMACFTVPRHWMFEGCEPDPECFHMAKQVLLGQFAKVALDAGTDVISSGEDSEAAEAVARLVSEMAAADPLWSPPDQLTLYHCSSLDVSACLGLFWQGTQLAGTPCMRPVQCWSRPFCSRMRDVAVEQLEIADAYSCRMTALPSRIKSSIARLGALAAMMVDKGDVVGLYYETFFCYTPSLRQPTRKVHECGALKVDLARFSKYALQLRVQERRFDRIAEGLGSGKAVCCIWASFYACLDILSTIATPKKTKSMS